MLARSPLRSPSRNPLFNPLEGKWGYSGPTALDIVAKYGGSFYDLSPANMFSERTGEAASTPVSDGGAVGTVKDSTDNGRHLVASADNRRPTRSDGGILGNGTNTNMVWIDGFNEPVSAANVIPMPDLSDSTAGKGFTCTGMCLSSDGTLWHGNHGIATPAITEWRPSLVNTTKAGVLIGEIDLVPIYPAIESVQGVVEDDEIPENLWFCSATENLVRCVTKAGVDVSSFTVTGCNAIAIDPATHHLIVATSGAVLRFNKAGVQQGISLAPPITIDQMHYDAASGMLYLTVDSTVTINFPDYVVVVHYPTWSIQKFIRITGPKAIEGVVLDGTDLYISSDEYFHGTAGDINRLYRFPITPPALVLHDKLTIVAVARRPTTANTKVLATVGDNFNGCGFGVWSASSADTTVRHIVNPTGGVTQRQTVNFVSPDLTSYHVIISEVDATTGKTRSFVDGVQIGTDQNVTGISAGLSLNQIAALCIGWGGGGYNSNGYMRMLGVMPAIMTADERSALTASLASRAI